MPAVPIGGAVPNQGRKHRRFRGKLNGRHPFGCFPRKMNSVTGEGDLDGSPPAPHLIILPLVLDQCVCALDDKHAFCLKFLGGKVKLGLDEPGLLADLGVSQRFICGFVAKCP